MPENVRCECDWTFHLGKSCPERVNQPESGPALCVQCLTVCGTEREETLHFYAAEGL